MLLNRFCAASDFSDFSPRLREQKHRTVGSREPLNFLFNQRFPRRKEGMVLEEVAQKLDSINQTLEQMLAVMRKPKNRVVQIVMLVGMFVGALGIVNVADTVFIGG